METKNIVLIGIAILVVLLVFFIFILPAIKDHLNGESNEVREEREGTVKYVPESI